MRSLFPVQRESQGLSNGPGMAGQGHSPGTVCGMGCGKELCLSSASPTEQGSQKENVLVASLAIVI